ncbi:MAG: glycerol-3-phosphate acyltransferase [Oscillospiraceae bacterium]|nr:glycerol-3-phosphate acyltransferase [Oscillospiraceae bacterium]
MAYVLATVIGYLFGCSNMAVYIAKYKKVDIRAKGSCNPGTSNAVILMGWRAGILVGLHDIGKGVLAVLLAKALFPYTPGVAEVAGAASVLGHIYPVFMKFRGGKGFASYIGMALAVDWRFALVVLAVVVLVTVITDYIVVGTTITVLALPVYLFIILAGWIALLAAGVASGTVIWKHRENYVRIYKGTEIGLRSTVKKEHRVA